MKFKCEKGQAMVEFALVLIPLLIIIGGIIDFGWIFYHKVIINNAVREGARYAAVHSKETTYIDDAKAKMNNILPTSLLSETINIYKDIPTTGDVKVTITGDIDILTPFISMIFTDSDVSRNGVQLEISAQNIMKME